MTTTVEHWTGHEIRALRQAKRMSLRTFAAHLGVSERVVSKWEAAGAAMRPRPVNQEALDTVLSACNSDARARFAKMLGTEGANPAPLRDLSATSLSKEQQHQVHHPVDGRPMALVDGGTASLGIDNEIVDVPEFYIDVFPVTNADYARFTEATGYQRPQHWVDGRFRQEVADHPVTYVSWLDAAAYAAWAAKSLPTSSQWEKAARGTRGDTYPWGSQATPAKCNVREGGLNQTTPTTRYHSGVSPYGVYDLCGNTWEWCDTETEAGRRELKGGAFTSPFIRATPSTFNDAAATMKDDDTGFRCVTPAATLQSLLHAFF